MTVMNEDTFWENYRLSPAEIRVIQEQCDTIRVTMAQVQEAAVKSDGKAIHDNWHQLVATFDYLNAVLRAKANAAVHMAEAATVADEDD